MTTYSSHETPIIRTRQWTRQTLGWTKSRHSAVRDATSGEETYGAGRYLDLEPDDHRTDDGRWVLDFNEAYNPTCAYSDRYECPLPPTDNWLDVPIEAGEKDF